MPDIRQIRDPPPHCFKVDGLTAANGCISGINWDGFGKVARPINFTTNTAKILNSYTFKANVYYCFSDLCNE